MTAYSISSGVTSTGLSLLAGDVATVFGGGTTIRTTAGAGALLDLKSGGTSLSATVNSGGSANIEPGGVGSKAIVNSGGYETVAGSETGSVVNGGGTEVVSGSGVALNTIVSSGGALEVSSAAGLGLAGGVQGGSTTLTTLNGGVESVFTGGTATNVVINSGGLLRLGYGASFYGGSATNVVINAGGSASLIYLAVLSGVIVQSGGVLRNGEGHVSGAVLSGGTEYVGGDVGELDTGTVISAGGIQYVQFYYGETSGSIVQSGGQQIVLNGNNVTSALGTVVNSGGLQFLENGGQAYGTIVNDGGSQVISNSDPDENDPVASATVVSNGGSQTVGVEGRTSGTSLFSGGVEIISSGGIASRTIVYAGGSEIISSGGLAVSTIVYGGSESIASGNITSGTTVYSGGLETVLAGGVASGTIVYSGGVESIAAGGVADGTTIQFGVSEVIGAGATVSGTVIDAGGRLVVSSGGITSDTHLKLGGTIDLPNLAFVDGETVSVTSQSTASYLLTVHDGGQTETLQLGNDPPGTLELSNDGSGGTAITAVGSLTGNISLDAGPLSDAPNAATTSASIIAAMTQALADWGEYVIADRPLQIQINIGTTTYPTELADDVVSFLPLPAGFSADTGTQSEGAAVSEAEVGIASGEAFPSPDITITINQADLNSIYFPPDPSGSYQVPAGEIDLVSLFEHEIGHAIGFDGLRDQSGVLENAESVFDTWANVSSNSASLVSPADENQYGGQPVPLTTGASNGANNYTLSSGSLYSLSDDLMDQSLNPGQRYQISGLDLAAVETAGVPAGLGYYSPVGVNQSLVAVQFAAGPATFTVTPPPPTTPNADDTVSWQLPGITNSTASTAYQIQREIWLTTAPYTPGSQGFQFYSQIEPYVDAAANGTPGQSPGLSGSAPYLLPASGTYYVTYVLSEQDSSGRYVQEQTISSDVPITFQSPTSAALTDYTPSQPDEGSDSSGQGDDSSSGESGLGSSNDTGGSQDDSTSAAALPIYRFFDTSTGTHLFTESQSEALEILSTRPDLAEEVDNFGAVPQPSPTAVPVYRFFETGNGTHFFTASYTEFLGLTTPGTATYRPDFTYEPNSTLYVDTIQETGDVAVYRLFDTVHGTQFLTGSQSEYQGLTTPGTSTYRPDLSPEGIAFYAPEGSSSI